MFFVNLLHANLALILSVLSGTIIPAVSAFLTKRPSGWTGAVTLALSAVAGFVGEWAAAPNVDTYDWRHGLSTAISALLVAFLTHRIMWQGSTIEAKLYKAGNHICKP